MKARRTVLDRYRIERPWTVAAIRLFQLTVARLSEIVNLKWLEIGDFGADGASVRLQNSKTEPGTVWLGPDAAELLLQLPRTRSGQGSSPSSCPRLDSIRSGSAGGTKQAFRPSLP